MQSFPINWWAVLAAAVVKIVLGGIWYSPIAFLAEWMRLTGVGETQMKATFPRAIAADIVGALIMAFVLAYAVHYAGAHTISHGLVVGFFSWLGFLGVVLLSQALYEQKPMRLFLINNSYLLLSLLLMGAILAVWS